MLVVAPDAPPVVAPAAAAAPAVRGPSHSSSVPIASSTTSSPRGCSAGWYRHVGQSHLACPPESPRGDNADVVVAAAVAIAATK